MYVKHVAMSSPLNCTDGVPEDISQDWPSLKSSDVWSAFAPEIGARHRFRHAFSS
jgi:hypothetical protein